MSRPAFILLLLLMLVNLWLGIEAQDLAYYFDDLFGVLNKPAMYLTIITVISLAIYYDPSKNTRPVAGIKCCLYHYTLAGSRSRGQSLVFYGSRYVVGINDIHKEPCPFGAGFLFYLLAKS